MTEQKPDVQAPKTASPALDVVFRSDVPALIRRLEKQAIWEMEQCSTSTSQLLADAAKALSALSGETELTSVDELEALPMGSVVLVYDKRAGEVSAWQLFDDVLFLTDIDGEKEPHAWASPAYKSEHRSADLVRFASGAPIRILYLPEVVK
jgi:hypothetical protein